MLVVFRFVTLRLFALNNKDRKPYTQKFFKEKNCRIAKERRKLYMIGAKKGKQSQSASDRMHQSAMCIYKNTDLDFILQWKMKPLYIVNKRRSMLTYATRYYKIDMEYLTIRSLFVLG